MDNAVYGLCQGRIKPQPITFEKRPWAFFLFLIYSVMYNMIQQIYKEQASKTPQTNGVSNTAVTAGRTPSESSASLQTEVYTFVRVRVPTRARFRLGF